MREIKFRGWDTDGIMYYSDANGEWTVTTNGVYCRYCGDRIMQYTGLKDKNGKEIYEGDIVKTPKGITTVTFDLACFYVETSSKYRLGGWDREAIEIIGNIYENPELLNQ